MPLFSVVVESDLAILVSTTTRLGERLGRSAETVIDVGKVVHTSAGELVRYHEHHLSNGDYHLEKGKVRG